MIWTKNSPFLLSSFEHCNRQGGWSRDWQRSKMNETEMLHEAIRVGLTSTRNDFGDAAGEECYGFGIEPGLDTEQMEIHAQVVHLSCIADIVTTAIRKPQDDSWGSPEPVKLGDGSVWRSAAYLDPSGSHLRRIVIASGWSDDRHYSEARSWHSLGEVCVYGLPLQQVVVVLGQNRGGKRHGYWTHGLRHPVSKKLRFRKRNDKSNPFKDTWKECWREDYDEISTKEWLAAMLEDGVLQDVCFKIDITVPDKAARKKILDLAARKLEKIENLKTLPDQQLSTCDWPKPCIFRGPCHNGENPNGKYGFVNIS